MHEVGGGLKNWEELSPGLPKCKLGLLTTHMNFVSLNKTHAVILFDPAREIFQMCIKTIKNFLFPYSLIAYTMVCGGFVENC